MFASVVIFHIVRWGEYYVVAPGEQSMIKSSEKARQLLSLGALVALVILPQECEGLAGEDREVGMHREARTVSSASCGGWVDCRDVYGRGEFHGDTCQTG